MIITSSLVYHTLMNIPELVWEKNKNYGIYGVSLALFPASVQYLLIELEAMEWVWRIGHCGLAIHSLTGFCYINSDKETSDYALDSTL